MLWLGLMDAAGVVWIAHLAVNRTVTVDQAWVLGCLGGAGTIIALLLLASGVLL